MADQNLERWADIDPALAKRPKARAAINDMFMAYSVIIDVTAIGPRTRDLLKDSFWNRVVIIAEAFRLPIRDT